MPPSRAASFSAASLSAALESSLSSLAPIVDRALSEYSTDDEDDISPAHDNHRRAVHTPSDISSDEEDAPLRVPLGDDTIPSRCGSFELVTEHKLPFAPIKIVKWQSQKTGLSVIWANTPGPIIKSWTTVVTEIFDDSGRPHTLEHLTFLGSKQYPWKGVLDKVANRCLANGTNAWTSVDNTTYTADTASEDGMLNLLPVYLDHIFSPTLRDSGFTTEVFNVNGEGHEGGVVYSEMQGRQGSSDDELELRIQQVLYDNRNGYRSETGGRLDALRHLKLADIQEYHSRLYVPQNVTVCVFGQAVHPLRLLKTLVDEVEPRLAAAGLANGVKPRGWKRPFVETSTAQNPPRLFKDEIEVVKFAEKDESTGEVRLHWIGPRAGDFLTEAALDVLGDYLSGNSVSPLNEEFVENKDPWASDISFTSTFADPSRLNCIISSVPAKKLHTVGPAILKSLANLLLKPFDLDRMKTTLHQSKLATLSVVESAAGTWLQANVLQDILYGPTDGSGLAKTMEDVQLIEKLTRWSAQDWLDLIDDYYVTPHSVTIIGQPSAEVAKKQAASDTERVEENQHKFGAAGLAKLAQQLADAQKQNSTPVPPQVVRSFKIPDFTKIAWLKCETAQARGLGVSFRGRVQQYVDQDPATPPVFIQFDHIPSSFIEICIVMHGSAHPLLGLYLDSFFSLPVNREDGTKLSFGDVVRQLDRDTLWRSIGTLGEGVALSIKVEKSKYAEAVAWCRDLLYGSVFDTDRLINSVVTSLQNAPSAREDDASVASAGHQLLILSEESVLTPTNLLNTLKTLPELLKHLRSDPKSVVRDLKMLRHDLTNHRAMRVSVKGDILSLKNPSSTWLTHFEKLEPVHHTELVPLVRQIDVLTPLGRRPARKFVVYATPSGESTYSRHMGKGPDWQSPDLPALQVAVAALNAVEGYLWRAVRGSGLAYGANIAISLETRALTFVVFKSPDALSAFAAAKKLIDSLISRQIEITQDTIDAAKSNIVHNVVSGLHTLDDAATASFVDTVILDRPKHYNRDSLDRVQNVQLRDVLPAIEKWIRPIFDAETSIGVAATSSVQLQHIMEGFQKFGYDVEEKKV